MKITIKENDKITVVKVREDEYGYLFYKSSKRYEDVCELAVFSWLHGVSEGCDETGRNVISWNIQ